MLSNAHIHVIYLLNVIAPFLKLTFLLFNIGIATKHKDFKKEKRSHPILAYFAGFRKKESKKSNKNFTKVPPGFIPISSMKSIGLDMIHLYYSSKSFAEGYSFISRTRSLSTADWTGKRYRPSPRGFAPSFPPASCSPGMVTITFKSELPSFKENLNQVFFVSLRITSATALANKGLH